VGWIAALTSDSAQTSGFHSEHDLAYDLIWLGRDLLPRKPQHCPTSQDESILASAIVFECGTV